MTTRPTAREFVDLMRFVQNPENVETQEETDRVDDFCERCEFFMTDAEIARCSAFALKATTPEIVGEWFAAMGTRRDDAPPPPPTPTYYRQTAVDQAGDLARLMANMVANHEAWQRSESAIDDPYAPGYPFAHSLDEMVHEVFVWRDAMAGGLL